VTPLLPSIEFGDVEVGGDTGEHVGIVARKMFFSVTRKSIISRTREWRCVQVVVEPMVM